jgi:hypothetical protein
MQDTELHIIRKTAIKRSGPMGIKGENVLESAQRVAVRGGKGKRKDVASQKGLCMPMQWFERKG